MLLIDHDMSLVLEVCDRLYVLDFGKVIASGKPEDIRNDPAVISAYLGTAEVEADIEFDTAPGAGLQKGNLG